MIGDRYVVKAGDCLWEIAHEALGSGNQWPRIWRYNNRREVVRITGRGIPNPDLIYPGQVLLIPRLPNASKVSGPSREESPTKHICQTNQSGLKLKPGFTASPVSPSSNGPLSSALPGVQSPISMKFRLEDMAFPPMQQPGLVMEIKMSGDIVLMSRKRYPATYVTQRRELEIQAVQQANDAFTSLMNDTRLIFDSQNNKLTYRSMLVIKSDQPHSWATAVGVQMDSSSPLPKLRFEFRAPNPLDGYLPQHTYRAIDVKIVIELTPRPSAEAPRPLPIPQAIPAPQQATNWGRVIGTGLVILGGAIVVGTLVEDFFTGLVGVADDPVSFAAAAASASKGWQMMRGGASLLPAAATPAMVSVTFMLAPVEFQKSEKFR